MSGGNLLPIRPDGVTLSVVSHGHDADVRVLLQSLAGFAAPQPVRVVLTLNRPEPALLAFVRGRTWPFEVHLRENGRESGFGANHNRAFADCDTAAFGVVNPDIRLPADPLGPLLAALGASERAGCAYPRQQTSSGVPQDSQRTLPTPVRVFLRRLVPAARRPAGPDDVDWVNGAFMLFDARAYAQIGGFDESYYMYGEDVDVCLRLQLAGYRLVPADVVVVHDAHRASHVRWQHLMWHLRSLLRLWTSATYRNYKVWRARQRA